MSNLKQYPWIIKDWAGNEIFGVRNGLKVELRFETFEDAEEHLTNLLGNEYETDRGEYLIDAVNE